MGFDDGYGQNFAFSRRTDIDRVRGPFEIGVGTWVVRLENTGRSTVVDGLRVTTLASEVVVPIALDIDDASSPTAAYSFTLSTDDSVYIDLLEASGSPTWSLIGPSGQQLRSLTANTPSGDLGCFELTAGEHTIRFDGAGTFRFSVYDSVQSSVVVQPGEFVTGVLPRPGDQITVVSDLGTGEYLFNRAIDESVVAVVGADPCAGSEYIAIEYVGSPLPAGAVLAVASCACSAVVPTSRQKHSHLSCNKLGDAQSSPIYGQDAAVIGGAYVDAEGVGPQASPSPPMERTRSGLGRG